MSGVVVYTIGQGSRTFSEVLTELKTRAIKYFCDVRSVPISNYAPEFCRDELKIRLAEHTISYVSLGNTIGGKPQDPTLYTSDGRVDYDRLMRSPEFTAGIDRIVRGATEGHRLALFCSEGRPEQCHRSKAIGRALQEREVEVRHIDCDGAEIEQHAVLTRLASQPNLFDVGYGNASMFSRRTYR